MFSESNRDLAIEVADSGRRLDLVVAGRLSDCSREQIKRWIASGEILLDGRIRRPGDRVSVGQIVTIAILPVEPAPSDRAQAIDLPIVHEDDDLLVIDKPVGLVVHPGNGRPDGTLMNGLLHRLPESVGLPRAGIVHRLDKDTSGLLVVAKTMAAYLDLVDQLKDKSVGRVYRALVWGKLTSSGQIAEPIGRHRVDRVRMAIDPRGKPAVTRYRPLAHYRIPGSEAQITEVECRLETGRTHQIRVHLSSIGFPIVGDGVYGLKRPRAIGDGVFDRQALHAFELSLTHPTTGETLSWTSPLPDDMTDLIARLDSVGKTDSDKCAVKNDEQEK